MIRFQYFPRTERPPTLVEEVSAVFHHHDSHISTDALEKGLTSDEVLSLLAPELGELGFQVELGKKAAQKIHRPVFFGENGHPTLRYEVDAYHPLQHCGLEIEAGRAWMGNAIYRDLVQAMVMAEVDTLILAVSNAYKYRAGGRDAVSRDYENTIRVAEAIYGHSRFELPYTLAVIGY